MTLAGPRAAAPLRWLVALLLFVAGGCSAAGAPMPGRPAPDALLSSMQVYLRGDSVNFLLQVTNTSTAPVRLRYPDGRVYDFAVHQGGREVWRWSEGMMFAQAIHEQVIEPGETIRQEASWALPAGARGSYRAVGILPASGATIEQAAEFTVEE